MNQAAMLVLNPFRNSAQLERSGEFVRLRPVPSVEVTRSPRISAIYNLRELPYAVRYVRNRTLSSHAPIAPSAFNAR